MDGESYKVIGVMPPGMEFPGQAQVWTPLQVRVERHVLFFRPVVARLKPEETLGQAAAVVRTIAQPIDEGGPVKGSDRRDVRVVLLKEFVTGGVKGSLRIFAMGVGFVLLIACANVANLLLMRAEARRQEIGIRMALGAGRRRLARQLVTESLLLGCMGGALAILLTLWGVPGLLTLAPKGWLPRLNEIHVDGAVLGFTLAVSVATGIFFGMFPAWQAARSGVAGSLRHGQRVSSGSGMRNVLAVVEIAMALVLLSGAGLMMNSLWRLHAVNSGFDPERVVTMTVDLPAAVYRQASDMQAFHGRILEKLSALPGVSGAAAVNSLPAGGMLFRGDFTLRDRKLPQGFAADKLLVTPGYFRAMGIKLAGGRDFAAADGPDAPRVAIVSRSVARTLWPGEDAVGRQVSESDRPQPKDWYTIVGVVDDVRQLGPTAKPIGGLYFPLIQTPHDVWLSHMSYVVRTESAPSRTAAEMRAVLAAVDPDLPARKVQAMEDVLAANGAARTFQARLLAAFALLAVVLAAIGVYGVLAYAVTARTREIGIRMVLGAGTFEVLAMVMRRTMLLGGAGLAAGSVGALFATRALEKLLFEVKPNDPLTFTAVAAVLGAVTLAAGWIPARRAARVDPLVAIRWE